jgi:hypothetical protein
MRHAADSYEQGGPAMDIVLIGSSQVANDERKKQTVRVPARSGRLVDRRRNKQDRRKGVRDGVVVSLSYPNDRRVNPDRRRTPTD